MIDRRELERLRMVSEEASYWFVRSRDETLNYAERRKLLAWLRRSPEHVAEMLRMVRMEGNLRVAEIEFNLTEEDDSNDYENVYELVPGALRRRRRTSEAPARAKTFSWNWKIAAAFVLVTVVSLIAGKAIWLDRSLSTGVSEWQHQRLVDGSLLHLGPRSDLRLSFGDSRRSVRMERGEAVFEVAKDPARPFTVRTELADVRAIGTTFGVTHFDRLVVTVEEGIVEVVPHDGSGAVRLHAGEEITIPPAKNGQKLAPDKVDAERKLKWRDGWVMFDGETLDEAVPLFNRRNHVQIVLDEQLAQYPIHFNRFKVNNPEEFAKGVAATYPNIGFDRDVSGRVLFLRSK